MKTKDLISRTTKISLIILAMTIITGCTGTTQLITTTNYIEIPKNQTILNYELTTIIETCKQENNINLTNTEQMCNDTTKPETATYNETSKEWGIWCCEYTTPKCSEETKQSFTQLCEPLYQDAIPTTIQQQGEKTVAICCTPNNMSKCYKDDQINVADNSTVCDLRFARSTTTIKYENNNWTATCCLTGVN